MIPLFWFVGQGHSEGEAIRLRICVVPPQRPWQWNGIGRKNTQRCAVKLDEFWDEAGNESYCDAKTDRKGR